MDWIAESKFRVTELAEHCQVLELWVLGGGTRGQGRGAGLTEPGFRVWGLGSGILADD